MKQLANKKKKRRLTFDTIINGEYIRVRSRSIQGAHRKVLAYVTCG